ncbi:GDSL-type esterase/lipase family protein [Acidovorax sp. K2F]|uniref:GDSL-type esterase/lipase family protein n=1 Tax=Acidovorax sp. K2F TaxID=2978125 RepID=UPI0021B0A521|nr:GDSL-type esterase/lipase family protein [Acidovorax sp. K2F]MCT6721686.1 GDSL-type esterase/lipase family protein [Acidovorax sp. K2F]
MDPITIAIIVGLGLVAAFALSRKGGGAASPPLPVSVTLDGDSILYGPTLAHNIAARLREWRPQWTVDDRGVYGLKLWQLIAGYTEPFPGAGPELFPRGPQPPYAQVQRNTRIVVLEAGGNDALEMRTVAEYEADLREAIRIVQAEGRTAVLTGIVDLPVADIFTPPIKARRDELNAVTLRVAAELGLQHAGWGEDYQGPQDVFDNVHRTQAASDRLAALLVAAIERAA